MDFLELIAATVTQGLTYALLTFGLFITYKLLDYPDLTVDGTFPLGAAITALLLTKGVSPWLTPLVAMAAGAAAGMVTGLIHVKLHVRDLLASIITMTALYSINLQIAGSQMTIGREFGTVFTAAPFGVLFPAMPLLYRKLIVSLVIVLLFKLILDLFFRTKSGMLLKATGDNAALVTTLAVDTGRVKILGLSLANALVALSGSIVCHEQRSYAVTMGTGQMVFGLAAVIIGLTIFRKIRGVQGTTAAIMGSIIYKLCIQVALSLKMPTTFLKLITAVLFLIILIVDRIGKRRKTRHA